MGTWLVKAVGFFETPPVFNNVEVPSSPDLSSIWEEGPSDETQCAVYSIPDKWWYWLPGKDIGGAGCYTDLVGTYSIIRFYFQGGFKIWLDNEASFRSISGLPNGFLITGAGGIPGPSNFVSGFSRGSRTLLDTSFTFTIDMFAQVPSFEINTVGANPGDPAYPVFADGEIRGSTVTGQPSLLDVLGLGYLTCRIDFLANASTFPNGIEDLFRLHYGDYASVPTFPYDTETASNFNGDYTIWSTELTLTPDTGIDGPFTITDGAAGLDQIVNISAIQGNTDTGEMIEYPIIITSQTAGAIVFDLPSGLIPNIPILIIGVLDGVQFDGSVLLGTLDILLTDGSGLYTLVPGKRNDTYYDRSTDPSETIDMKIPNPFIKTGSIP